MEPRIGLQRQITCNECGKIEPWTLVRVNGRRRFWKEPGGTILWFFKCADCYRARCRVLRARPHVRKRIRSYYLTPKGYLVATYCDMKKRCSGKVTRTKHIYEGLEVLKASAFYSWSLRGLRFRRLLAAYIKAGRPRGLAPSVDRIDPMVGYVLGNIRWMTNRENSSRGIKEVWRKWREENGPPPPVLVAKWKKYGKPNHTPT